MPDICRTCGELILSSNSKILFDEIILIQQIHYLTGLWVSARTLELILTFNCCAKNRDINFNADYVSNLSKDWSVKWCDECIPILKLENNAEMPSQICSRCQYDLKEAIKFRERCISTQQHLQQQQQSQQIMLPTTKYEDHDPLITEAADTESLDKKSCSNSFGYPTATISPDPTFLAYPSLDELPIADFDVVIKEEDEYAEHHQHLDPQDTQSTRSSSNADEDVEPYLDVKLQESNVNAATTAKTITKKRRKKLRKSIQKKKIYTENIIKRVQQHPDYLCDQCGIHFRTQNDLNAHIERHEVDSNERFAEETQQESTDAEAEPDEADIDINKLYTKASVGVSTATDKNNKKRRNIKWKNLTEVEAKALKEKLKRERDFYCTQCGKHFNDPGNYRVHLLRHTGVKKYECKTCNMKFYTASLMRRHERIHITQYQCTHCGQKFNHNSSRLRHEKLHTNDRPFKCNYCEKSFPSSSSLKTHELCHIGVRQFYCELCDQGFIRQTYYSSHCRSRTHLQNEQKMTAATTTSSSTN